MDAESGSADRAHQVQIRIRAVGNVPRLHLDGEFCHLRFYGVENLAAVFDGSVEELFGEVLRMRTGERASVERPRDIHAALHAELVGKLKLLHHVFEIGLSRRRIGRHHIAPGTDFRDQDPGVGKGLPNGIHPCRVAGFAIRTERGCIAQPNVLPCQGFRIVCFAISSLSGYRINGGNAG